MKSDLKRSETESEPKRTAFIFKSALVDNRFLKTTFI